MLPSLVSAELQDEIHRFLHSAFPVATPWFLRTASGEDPPKEKGAKEKRKEKGTARKRGRIYL